jgi:hypothetical protein
VTPIFGCLGVVEPWAPDDKQNWIRLLPTTITGRTIRLPDIAGDNGGYV